MGQFSPLAHFTPQPAPLIMFHWTEVVLIILPTYSYMTYEIMYGAWVGYKPFLIANAHVLPLLSCFTFCVAL